MTTVYLPESYHAALACTYGTELLALVSHLFPYRPALRPEEVSQVDGVDGRAGLLVQSGLLADPVKDLPVQRTVVVQEGLRSQEEKCETDERNTGEEWVKPGVNKKIYKFYLSSFE